jgi:hypothetical protein
MGTVALSRVSNSETREVLFISFNAGTTSKVYEILFQELPIDPELAVKSHTMLSHAPITDAVDTTTVTG